MLKLFYSVCIASVCSLFLYSCTLLEDDLELSRRCETSSSCETGYECQKGICQYVGDVVDTTADSDGDSAEDFLDEDLHTCIPACDANLCQECSGRECVSKCTDEQFCRNGECEDNICNPECHADVCRSCRSGQCVSDCVDGEVCEAGQCVAEPYCNPGCSSSDCEECVNGSCELACSDDEVCNAGECVLNPECDPECDSQACEECIDGECILTCHDDEVCNNNVCRSVPEDCGNGELDSGEECDGEDLKNETCETRGFERGELSCSDFCTFNEDNCIEIVCEPDDMEPNSTSGSAAEIELAFEENELTLCSVDEEDWFVFELEANNKYNFYLTFIDEVGDVDFYLYAENDLETFLVRGYSATDDEDVPYVVPEDSAGTYYIKVVLYSGESQIYDLFISDGAAVECTIDGNCDDGEVCEDFNCVEFICSIDNPCSDNQTCHEGTCVNCVEAVDCPNEVDFICEDNLCVLDCEDDLEPNDSAEESTELTIPFANPDLKFCEFDVEDWFEVNLSADWVYSFDLSFVDADGDVDLYLYYEDSLNSHVAQALSMTDDEHVNYAVDEGGIFYLEVRLESFIRHVQRYSLIVDELGPIECETNGDCDSGEICEEGLCVEFVCNEENVCFDNLVCAEGVCIECLSNGDCNNSFLCEEHVCLLDCDEDFYEPDNTYDGANPIEIPFREAMTLCGGSAEDWFVMTLNPGIIYTFDLLFTHSAGDINAYLYAEGDYSTYKVRGFSGSDNESFTYSVPEDGGGTYYFKVLNTSSWSHIQTYDIAIGAENVCADAYEGNVDVDNAASIDMPFEEALTLCADNEQDWFSFALEADAEYAINLFFSHSEGDLDAWLYAEGEYSDYLVRGYSSSDNEELIYTVPEDGAGTYYLKILSSSTSSQNYDLTISSSGSGDARTCETPGELQMGENAGDTTEAANDIAYPSCSGSSDGPDEIWALNPACDGPITLVLTPGWDATLSVTTECGNAETEVGDCTDNSTRVGTMEFEAVMDTTYYVTVSAYSTASGPYTLEYTTECSFPKDCDNPGELIEGEENPGDTTGMPTDVAPYIECGSNDESPDEMWSFTPECDGTANLTITPEGDFDVVASVFAACDGGGDFPCVDDNTGEETISMEVEEGTTYFLAITGYDSEGVYNIDYSVSCAAMLVINELSYDDHSTDNKEFVEIYGDPDLDLTGYHLVHINGNGGGAIWAIDLTGYATNSEGFFVIGSTTLGDAADVNWEVFDLGDTNAIQNGGDSMALFAEYNGDEDAPDGNLIDLIGYETANDMPFEGDNPSMGVGHGSWETSIGRFPDGNDSDNNLEDIPALWWITPGMPNTPANPPGFDRVSSLGFDEPMTPVDIPDNDTAGIDLVIDMTDSSWFAPTVLDLKVGVRIVHTYQGDLIVKLTSPDGVEVPLHNRSGSGADDLMTVYGLETDPVDPFDAMIDGTGTGMWTLNVSDNGGGDEGHVLEWVLWVQGPEGA